jgi:Tfp pilus assembly protein PilV
MKLRPAQIMIELVIALAIAMVAVVALIQNTTKSVSNSIYSRSQTTANGLVVEAIEWLRKEKNKSWPDFSAKSGIYCLNSLDWNTTSPCPTGQFKRDLSKSGDTVTVTVSWDEKGRNFSVSQSVTFSKY